MKTLLIILFTASMAWAGSETLDPNSDIYNDWTCVGIDCPDHWRELSDNNDAGYDSSYNSDTDAAMYGLPTASTADSTIDSVVYHLRVKLYHVNNTVAILDSVAGQTAASPRQSSTISNTTTSYFDSTRSYTTDPDGGEWSWTDITNLNIGYTMVNAQNKQSTLVSELWAVVWYTYAAAGGDISYVRRIKEQEEQ